MAECSMRIKGADVSELSLLKKLDPFDKLYMMALPGYHCMVAYADEPGEEDTPSGVILFGVVGDTITVEWLFVKKDFRSLSVGDALLDVAYEIAVLKQTKKLYAYLIDSKKMIRRIPSRASFFSDRFFEKTIKVPGEWHTTIMSLRDAINDIGVNIEALRQIRPLSAVPKSAFRGLLDALLSSESGECHCDLSPDNIALDYSVVYGDDNEGALLFADTGGMLTMTGFFAESMDIAITLFYGFLMQVKAAYPALTEVNIRFRNFNNDALLSKLSGDRCVPARLVMADLPMYIGARGLDTDRLPFKYDFLDAFYDSF